MVLPTANRDKRLLDIINWRPRDYHGDDWRRILLTIKGRKTTGRDDPVENQTETTTSIIKEPVSLRPIIGHETPRDKLHARCRTTLRVPRYCMRSCLALS